MVNMMELPPPVCTYSVVVPMNNEERHVEPLYAELVSAMDALGEPYEVIFVDDGSSDATFELLANIAEADSRVRVIRLKKNFGQTAALAAGFDHVQGEIIITMDGDLRSSPAEIPILLDKLSEGYDVVSGWRKDRRHEGILRTLPAAVANRMLAKISGLRLRDFGTSFKVYRREVVKALRLQADQHRFIPVLANWTGTRVAEVPVSDSARKFGESHYGLKRILRVSFDLVTIHFLQHYRTRPLHFFGVAGALGLIVGSAMLLYLLAIRLFTVHVALFYQGLLAVFGGLFSVGGLQLFGIGLAAELLVRNHIEAQHEPIYRVERIIQTARDQALGALTRQAQLPRKRA